MNRQASTTSKTPLSARKKGVSTATVGAAASYLLLSLAAIAVLFPPAVVLLNAFKGDEEYAASGVFDLPDSFLNFGNFSTVVDIAHLGRAFGNTAFIMALSLIGNVLIGTMVAYSLGRFTFRLRSFIFGAYIAATLVPSVTTQVATFTVIKHLGLYNTHFAPILLYLGTDVVQIYLYLQFIRSIPYDLDESAMMEGASLFYIYRAIVFPLLAPATATVVILKSISIYNDMYIPYLYMPAQKLGVVSTSLMNFAGVNSAQWNLICAALLIVLIPTVILYLLLQRYIFSGIVSGSVK